MHDKHPFDWPTQTYNRHILSNFMTAQQERHLASFYWIWPSFSGFISTSGINFLPVCAHLVTNCFKAMEKEHKYQFLKALSFVLIDFVAADMLVRGNNQDWEANDIHAHVPCFWQRIWQKWSKHSFKIKMQWSLAN